MPVPVNQPGGIAPPPTTSRVQIILSWLGLA